MTRNNMFTNKQVSSTRIIYTPSSFARSSLFHLQETGRLRALHPHKSERSGLQSCLFFTVLSGKGKLIYDGQSYPLTAGDCVFIDCRKAYSHEAEAENLWTLQWCHFYGPNMSAIYQKYQQRGGKPVFCSKQVSHYQTVLTELYQIAETEDYVRDMRLHEKLSSLLTLLMEDAWNTEKAVSSLSTSVNIQNIKEYLDENFKEKITLDQLASVFFINKYYLLNLFKNCYGLPINAYLNQVRVTYVKQQLRFTDKTVEALAEELHIEPAYLSRLFKKMEGITPRQFRKSWNGYDSQSF